MDCVEVEVAVSAASSILTSSSTAELFSPALLATPEDEACSGGTTGPEAVEAGELSRSDAGFASLSLSFALMRLV